MEFGNAVGEDHPPDGDTKGRNKCATAGRAIIPGTTLPLPPARYKMTGCPVDRLEELPVYGMITARRATCLFIMRAIMSLCWHRMIKFAR